MIISHLYFQARVRRQSACSMASPATRSSTQTVAEASEAIGIDLARMIAEGPKEELDLTTNTQPVMLTAAVAV